jgi:peptide/nickel transport system substrate-binding protein
MLFGCCLLALGLSAPAATTASLPREAPMLAAQVAAGKLPPLAQRLPAHPLEVPVVEGLGEYGGTWHTYHIGVDMVSWRLINNYTPLVRWNAQVNQLIPGLAESWEFRDDGRTIVFKLRAGVRWSDGAPFTSADILYWWQLCNNPRVIYKPPEWAYAAGQRMQVEAPDATTLIFRYAAPFYFVPNFMATGFWVPEAMLLPRHYLKQFDPTINPAYADYNELVRKNYVYDNPDRPTLSPWKLSVISPTGDRAVFERNPYYYGVDPAGRQLPYIDRVESTRVQSSEAGVLLIIGGNIDAQFRLISQEDYSLLKRFSTPEDYRILHWEEGTAAWYSVCMNWSVADPARRALFRDKRFRRALSVGINRERINQVVWRGLGRPQAGAISDEAWHFHSPRGQQILKRWITEWSQYDPALANRWLDECGLNERDAAGYRLYRGQPFSIQLDFPDDHIAVDESTLIADDWKQLGLNIITRRAIGADMWTRVQLGKFDMYLQHNSEMDLFSFPAFVFPTANINWHPLIGKWYMTGGKEGERPTGVMAQLLDLYEQCKREPDLAKRHNLVLDAIELHLQEGPFYLGTCGRQPDLVIAKNNFRNVPRTGILGPLAICQPGSQYPEQFYIRTSSTAPEVQP